MGKVHANTEEKMTIMFSDEQIALKELAQDFFIKEVKPVAAEIV